MNNSNNIYFEEFIVISKDGTETKKPFCFSEVNNTLLYIYPLSVLSKGDVIKELKIPNNCNGKTIKSISKNVFFSKDVYDDDMEIANHYHPVEKLVLPDTIEYIDNGAFFGTVINEVVWAKGCSTIPGECFSGSSINKISNVDDVLVIKSRAFYACEDLVNVSFPNCKIVDAQAFSRCISLTNASFPSVKEVYSYAFSSCGFEAFGWPENSKVIPPRCFEGCQHLKNIHNMDKVQIVSDYAFSGCGFETFDWPDNIQMIPPFCFQGCKNLKTLNINNISTVGYKSLEGTKITKLDLSKSIICAIDKSLADSDIKVLFPFYQQQSI